jgi:hypothetical protein
LKEILLLLMKCTEVTVADVLYMIQQRELELTQEGPDAK